MLLSKEVEISVLNNNISYLRSLGYDVNLDRIIIKIEDLSKGSKILVNVKCDICGEEKMLSYYNYNKSVKNGGVYCCCSKCSNFKKKSSNVKKFGVEWASQSPEIKEKVINTNLQRWGVTCTLNNPDVRKKALKTNLSRWGVDKLLKSPEIRAKIKETNLRRRGVDCPLKSPEIRAKIENTNKERWGVDNPMKNKTLYLKMKHTKLIKYGDENYNNREKFKITSFAKYGRYYTQTEEYKTNLIYNNLLKWGVQYVSQSEEVKKKVKNTKLRRYGDENYNNIDKIRKTNLIRWGTEFVFKSPIIRQNIEKTNILKYGVKNLVELSHIREKCKRAFDLYNKKYIMETYSHLLKDDYQIIEYSDKKLRIKHDDHEFQISIKLLYDRLKFNNCQICTICNPKHSNLSSYENEICEWLTNTGVEYITRDRTLLGNKEIDIYIADKKIAIEFNGTYWHSDAHKDRYYHINKTLSCKKLGIDLIHIFEDQWIVKKDIIKSIILNRLGRVDIKRPMKKCNVSEITNIESKIFLNANSLYGYRISDKHIGLFYEDQLISVMSININSNFTELINFAVIINTIIPGGLSRMLDYVNDKYKVSRVISKIDVLMFNGESLKKLGFAIISDPKPTCIWVTNNVRYKHRPKYKNSYKIWSYAHVVYEKIN